MKKYFAGLITVLSLAIVPMLVSAAPTDIDPSPSASTCVSLNNNLRYQSRDNFTNGEVSTLQDFLQSQNYLNSEPTGYFGLLTLRAAKNFQSANGISPTGYVGPITRAKISSLTCDTSVIPPTTTNPVQPTVPPVPVQTQTPAPVNTAPVVWYPNGGENLQWGNYAYITWNPVNYSSSFGVFLKGVASGNVYIIKQNVPVQATDKMFVSWIPTQGSYEKDTQFIARVCRTGTTICDESNGSFTISNPVTASLTVLYPNGGEVLSYAQQSWISWTPDSYIGSYDVSIRGVNSGNIYSVKQNVPSSATDKLSVSWTPTAGNYEKDTLFVARVCRSGTQICDESNSSFSIPNAYSSQPTVLYPNGGEVLNWGQSTSISWTPDVYTGYYDIFVRGIGSGNVYTVKQNVPSSATDKLSISWTPIQGNYEKDTQFATRVCKSGTQSCDESNSSFSIPNSYSKPVLLYPVNGEVLQGGTTQYISWSPQNSFGSFDVYIRGVYSGNVYTIKQNVPNASSDKISTSWIPTAGSYEKDTQFIARVCITGTTICGESSSSFSVKF